MSTAREDLRERVARLLKANGEAGDVERDSDGSLVFQFFIAQAGPFRRDTPVCVLSEEQANEIQSLIERALRVVEQEPVAHLVENADFGLPLAYTRRADDIVARHKAAGRHVVPLVPLTTEPSET